MIGVWLSTAAGAHELARSVVAQTLCVDVESVELGREPGGRPTVMGRAGLHLAISHTRGAAAVAISTLGPVGVDVEIDRGVPLVELARRWFAPQEADWVARHPEDFLLLWTQKEAVGKALGIGLRHTGLRRLMPLPPATGLARVPGHGSMAVMSWRRSGLALSLACVDHPHVVCLEHAVSGDHGKIFTLSLCDEKPVERVAMM